MWRGILALAVLAAVGALPAQAADQPYFRALGHLPGALDFSHAYAVNADGTVVVGSAASASGMEAFRWTAATGMVGLGDLPGGQFSGDAFGVSGDGSVIVGNSYSSTGEQAFRWTKQTGMQPLYAAGMPPNAVNLRHPRGDRIQRFPMFLAASPDNPTQRTPNCGKHLNTLPILAPPIALSSRRCMPPSPSHRDGAKLG